MPIRAHRRRAQACVGLCLALEEKGISLMESVSSLVYFHTDDCHRPQTLWRNLGNESGFVFYHHTHCHLLMHLETDTLMHLEHHFRFFPPHTSKITKGRTWVGLSIMPDGAAASCPPLSYLSPCSCINSDSAPNASSLSSPSDTLDYMPEPPCSDFGCEKHLQKHLHSVPLEASVKSIEHEPVTDEKLRRSRRLSTLFPPAYSECGSEPPPSCMSPFSTLFFQDNSKELEEASPYISLEPDSTFQKIRRFRLSFHLSQLLPAFSLPPFLDSPSLWLALYFALNLWLTLYNKSVLIHFPFPYTLTALHALCGTIGSSILLRLQRPDLSGSTGGTTQKSSWSFFRKITPELNLGESIVLLFFSMLYTINIVVSNASLRLVTVPVSVNIISVVLGNLFLISFTVSSSCARLDTFLHNRVFFDSSQ